MENSKPKSFGTKKKIAAAGIGAGLLAGLIGGSSLLWSDTETANVANIQAGNLDLDVIDTTWMDVTDYRADNPHAIDPAEFKMVPGDTIAADVNLDLGLEGDNLTAKIDDNKILESLGLPDDAKQYVTVDTQIFQKNADGSRGAEVTKTDGAYTFHSPLQGGTAEKPGTLVTPAEVDGKGDADLLITLNFSKDTPDQILTKADLTNFNNDGVDITLEQVLEPGTK